MSYNYQDAPRESQQEYFGKVHTDNKETLYNALKRIEELEKENERLKGDLELWESGGCRATNLFECGVVKELKERLAETNLNGNIVLRELTKAKEIIKNLLILKKDHFGNTKKEWSVEVTEQAEQFLRETDIDNAIQKANEGLDLDKIADEVEQDIKEQKVK